MNSLQHQEAEEVFKAALKIDPNSEQARECLKVLEAMKKGLEMGGDVSGEAPKSV